MAMHTVRLSPATQLHGGISSNLSPPNRKPNNSIVRYGCGSSKRFRIVTVLASLRENDANGRDNSVRAMEVKKIFEDSPLLPKPLSSNQLTESVSNGSRVRVAYQGVRGAYSESAAEKAYPNCEAVPCEEFDTAFEAVERWLVDRAVLPIENSLGGSIHRNYDLLLRHNLHIVGEVKLAVRHCLLANHGVNIEDLRRVLSHPQALAQCENTLTKLGLVREAVDDTAGAAKQIAFENLNDAAAVASEKAAKIYGLNIVAKDIQDDCDNVTRFLMLAREPIIPGTNRLFKTSIVFSLEEGPGVLFKALAVFALRQINLTKIESRPLRKHPLRASGGLKYFDYLFYVDFEASMADEVAQNALRHLEEFATFLRVLGSYPVDTTML
ncbi:putative P-protein: chorismate mutase, prephenate dehydratase [Arabidopsis thaliana]|uniref:Arogenate dehydratase/prephenate dehydratase 2, chloroplastic n=1 Tax=Arabidopsis thaliana TaxID=3702 RepID=AROD2_ARATH|nr:arogenate dehydratase 2 [Arabidopsis thaliana]NP_187420.1 arogenate dehydratase 2 [Arabidopsis thaliana]NP_974249.1 arogenate dehydratase 2 [Arabidopsis thaliana]Q9SSE7.1 RecName: Full=Arogenate dehydratase/prephenate dehydratase 2, chloroplastic; Short=AtADT2; Short=AtPDT2; Flags: Precursor [Arabidopsis thaliana]AAF13081.1 putative P-protein: chorismate mutase, prephenate dehydratase [Arabidopsis thaliana]AAK92748.1 putative P-protein: chorismate mutase, prephenate dehydratase [Arabidopsis|eukprot:NP_001325505.1 arogenate dehydratase 2 [Arabidopsis thaliana]